MEHREEILTALFSLQQTAVLEHMLLTLPGAVLDENIFLPQWAMNTYTRC